MIIARRDANIQSLQELKGKRFAWVDPGSTSGYLYPRAMLVEKGLDPDATFSQQVFAGGHDKVVIAVMNGQVDAGAISEDFRQRPNVLQLYPRVMEETIVVQKTADIPNDGVAFNKDLPREIVDKTKQGLINISNRPEGKKFFTDTIGTLGVAPTTDAAYDPVRNAATVLKLDLEAEIAKPK
jgi:phosphonate transport system substrate-binding protein